MKIIGKTAEGFIVDISASEIKSLLSVENEKRKDPLASLKIGDEIQPTIALSNLHLLRSLKESSEFHYLKSYTEDAMEKGKKFLEAIEKMDQPLSTISSKIGSERV
jgi:hypothetical protein